MNTLQDRLIYARKLADKTQGEIAEAVGMSQSNYSQLEKGKVMSSTALPQLANALGVDVNWLITGNANIQNHGIYTGGDNYGTQTNYSLSQTVAAEQHQEQLSSGDQLHLKDLIMLDIDCGVQYAINPASLNKAILDNAERVATFIPHSRRTFGIKVADEIRHITPSPIQKNDILITEPAIMPRNGDLVLVCLEHDTNKRGIIARLKIDIDGTYKMKYDDTEPVAMPSNSLICGVVIEIKRRLIDNALLKSRLNQDWNILSTLQQ